MLDHTPKEINERSALVVNPAKTCQPIGAMYAALGIHRCLPHSHGSQGCCSYHRMHLTRHYRDPIVASTSSFTEGACVFGGKSNLKKGIENVFEIYDPDVIAVNTTCLSETIGDDLNDIVLSTKVPEGKTVIYASTPSYQGSHVTGFSNMTKAMVTHMVNKNKIIENGKLAVIPGYVEPSDMSEIKRMLSMLGAPFTMFPDTSGVVNSPNTGKYEMYPEGGTTVEELSDLGNCEKTIAMGKFSSEAAAFELEKLCDVEANVINIPIGIKATDDFVMKVLEATGNEMSKELEFERGQLVDLMIDIHNHYHGKKVAIFGDPDIVIPMTEFVISLGMVPKYILTGTPGNAFEKSINEILKEAGIEGSKVKAGGDLMTLHQWMKNEAVDMLIGNTYGKYIARAEDVPLIRVGFPILDRVGHSLFPTVGYKGAMRLIEKISTAFLDKYDRECTDEDFELVM
ncbi:nitrogenase molybdenum-iron protein subunit beta [Alkalibacter saccharofermentans]|uniref:Nitrogenase molybdenum-iron protein beta chain n=1 Tax=Alkalibacter saccharofermentans DSM 14828 TaxID=1120975 RepID=A0A1M4S4B1_9FIRM|nr:nitrogenase molybdenum-iron protein subunit beta [Alkalibacter saccharofermentans]SHE27009.1 Mo-nitrogenase MoFe protein subunit NifK [Alkalibacter saccharofermentans DSM 14828]